MSCRLEARCSAAGAMLAAVSKWCFGAFHHAGKGHGQQRLSSRAACLREGQVVLERLCATGTMTIQFLHLSAFLLSSL